MELGRVFSPPKELNSIFFVPRGTFLYTQWNISLCPVDFSLSPEELGTLSSKNFQLNRRTRTRSYFYFPIGSFSWKKITIELSNFKAKNFLDFLLLETPTVWKISLFFDRFELKFYAVSWIREIGRPLKKFLKSIGSAAASLRRCL